jgi:hypothetical protein
MPGGAEEGSSSFLKKRTKKLLLLVIPHCAVSVDGSALLRKQKFFASFFQKRSACFCLSSVC